MKTLLIIALFSGSMFSCFISADNKYDSVSRLEDVFTNFLECIRELLIIGNPDWGVPTFNPLEIREHKIDFANTGISGISGNLLVSNLIFSGLTDFVILNVTGSAQLIPLGYIIEISLNYPRIELETEYVLDLKSESTDYHLDGNGTLSLICTDFSFGIKFRIRIDSGPPIIISTQSTLEGCEQFKITGIRDNKELSELISKEVMENAASWVSMVSPSFGQVFQESFLIIWNIFLRNGLECNYYLK